MKKSNCLECKHLIQDKAGSWMGKDDLVHYIPPRWYCLLNNNWTEALQKKNCGFYEQRREKKGTC